MILFFKMVMNKLFFGMHVGHLKIHGYLYLKTNKDMSGKCQLF